MDELIAMGAQQAAGELRAGRLSVAELVGAHVARMRAVNPAINAVVDDLGDAALDQARAMDAARPDDPPPLWGLPVTVKINVDFKGRANSNGLPALADMICAEDAPVVANLRRAGAVIIGRTNTPEFSLRWFTSNPLHGETRNPVAASRTPGGSSGGAAAALAAGIGVLAHGNDLGGSLRYPAYCVGAVSLRPSLGRVPAWIPSTAPGERPASLQMMSVQGVIARSAADNALAFGPLAARDVRDPLWSSAPDSGRPRPRPWRIGVCPDPFGDGTAPEVARALDTAAQAFRDDGHEVIDTALPLAHEAAWAWGQLLNAETQVMSRAEMERVGSAQVMATLDGYARILGVPDMEGFMRAQAMRLTVQRAWALMFEEIDLLLMPVSAALPFERELDFAAPDRLGEMLAAQRALYVVNLSGHPGLSVPVASAGSVPCGVQIVGARSDDRVVLEAGMALERALGPARLPVDPAGG